MRPGGRVGITLPPTSAHDVPYYNAWRGAAAELSAPIAFGVGHDRGLDELYAQCRAVLTTSVKEGFGMSFLEPATRGRATCGRRLPRVIPDFEAEGLSFPSLYEAIAVPPGLFDQDALARRITAVVSSAMVAYGRSDDGFAALVVGNILEPGGQGPDFGRLDETAQLEVLRSLSTDRRARSALLALNPFIDGWDETAEKLDPPSREALDPWSEAVYGQRLADIYRRALDSGGGSAPDNESLLNIYLRPEAFYGVGV